MYALMILLLLLQLIFWC